MFIHFIDHCTYIYKIEYVAYNDAIHVWLLCTYVYNVWRFKTIFELLTINAVILKYKNHNQGVLDTWAIVNNNNATYTMIVKTVTIHVMNIIMMLNLSVYRFIRRYYGKEHGT